MHLTTAKDRDVMSFMPAVQCTGPTEPYASACLLEDFILPVVYTVAPSQVSLYLISATWPAQLTADIFTQQQRWEYDVPAVLLTVFYYYVELAVLYTAVVLTHWFPIFVAHAPFWSHVRMFFLPFKMYDSTDAFYSRCILNDMKWNVVLFMIRMCHAGRLPCAFVYNYGICTVLTFCPD